MGQSDQPAGRRAGATGAGRRIYDLLRAQIADGTLAPGAPAPSTRGLAAELGVSRTTVTAAYEQLAAEGFLVTARGRAARIAAAASRSASISCTARWPGATSRRWPGGVPGRPSCCASTTACPTPRPQARHRCGARCRAICAARAGWPATPGRSWWCMARSRPSTCARGCCWTTAMALALKTPAT
ncbi:protein of unknown function (plasmid) [Cupriavidus taiwanensis]|nr:protein of unknown function [Cupriavidus taiwanensis]